MIKGAKGFFVSGPCHPPPTPYRGLGEELGGQVIRLAVNTLGEAIADY